MSSENSTNVRFEILRASVAALQRISPALAARAIAPLFLRTPPRRRARAALPDAARPFEIRVDRTLVRGFSVGEGPAVLLLHGWGGRSRQLLSFVAPLRRRGYRVVAFDAPGHGASSGDELTLPAFASAIRAVAAALGPIHALVAHSFGAAASALAIAEGLAVERAVFIGSPSDPLRWFNRFAAAFALSPETKQRAKTALERRVGASFSRFTAEALGPALELPTLVVHDRSDRDVPWEDGARIARAAPAATLLTTEGLGHTRILRDPSVIERVVAFVGGDAPSAEPLRVGCKRCGGSLFETWQSSSEICMSCELQLELWEPRRRWSISAA